MTFPKAALAAVCVLAACSAPVPDSNPNAGQGVGFGGYERYAAEQAARDAALERTRTAAVPEERAIASETIGVLNATRTGGASPLSATAPVQPSAAPAAPAAPVAVATVSNAGISDEQNFDAVSSRETIESDKERLARQREAYAVVQPEAIPDRPGNTGPNIVAFALSTTNTVGQSVYRRPGTTSDSKFQRACARYSSSDQAQAAFLEAGGPKTDRQGLDPDGDGFACYWDPAPFRAARGG